MSNAFETTSAAPGWRASLALDYTDAHGRTVARYRHSGPLRVLQSLYPEGQAICHNVLVHPPAGIVGGDRLEVQVQVGEGAHGLVTTPGATRFYRSTGLAGVQQAELRVAAGARLEWLPLEAIYYPGCQAENRLMLDVAPDGEMIGWDIAALGLPHAGQPFAAPAQDGAVHAHGQVLQHIEWPGIWLERGLIRSDARRFLDSPLGLAGHTCLASIFFVAGRALARDRREAALEAARACIAPHALANLAGATSPNPHVLVARAVAPAVEPAFDLLRTLRSAWRETLWHLGGASPRIWSM